MLSKQIFSFCMLCLPVCIVLLGMLVVMVQKELRSCQMLWLSWQATHVLTSLMSREGCNCPKQVLPEVTGCRPQKGAFRCQTSLSGPGSRPLLASIA